MTPQEISAAYRTRHASLAQQLGRRPTVSDPEYWELENWYMDRHRELIKGRAPVEIQATAVTITPEPGSSIRHENVHIYVQNPAPPLERSCRECGAHIPPTGRRGRPPTRCEECRTP